MKRKQLPLISQPLKSLRPSGSAYRFYVSPLFDRFNQMQSLVSVMWAAQNGNLEMIKYHVENSSQNFSNERFGPYSRNLLHLVAISDNIDAIKYITEKEIINPLKVDSHGHFPYQLAKGQSKEYLKKYTLWKQRKVMIFWHNFQEKQKIPVGILRQLCSDHFSLL
jgi:hypothetical protein